MAREAAPLLDRFRRPIFPGVKVEFHTTLPIIYTVAAVTPVVDPRMPAGLHQLTLVAQVDLKVAGGVPVDELTAIIYPKAVDADKKPELPRQDDDSPAGPNEYVPPEGDPS